MTTKLSPITGKPDANIGPDAVQPTRAEGGAPYNDYRERHPAYATIAAARVSGGRDALFDSDFRHQHWVTITIRKADVTRSNISTEHIFAHDDLIEVALSEAQWATFVATPNSGMGVPCTLERIGRRAIGEALEPADVFGRIPGIVPIEDTRSKYRADVDKRLQRSIDDIAEVGAALKDGANLGAQKRRDLAMKLSVAMATFSAEGGVAWVAKQFDEHTEQTVEKAKIEVNAYMTAAVYGAGLQALGVTPPLELGSGPDPEEDPYYPDPADSETTALTFAESLAIEGNPAWQAMDPPSNEEV